MGKRGISFFLWKERTKETFAIYYYSPLNYSPLIFAPKRHENQRAVNIYSNNLDRCFQEFKTLCRSNVGNLDFAFVRNDNYAV